jgi:hypothetical protein
MRGQYPPSLTTQRGEWPGLCAIKGERGPAGGPGAQEAPLCEQRHFVAGDEYVHTSAVQSESLRIASVTMSNANVKFVWQSIIFAGERLAFSRASAHPRIDDVECGGLLCQAGGPQRSVLSEGLKLGLCHINTFFSEIEKRDMPRLEAACSLLLHTGTLVASMQMSHTPAQAFAHHPLHPGRLHI